jgi:phage tail P2-like protein
MPEPSLDDYIWPEEPPEWWPEGEAWPPEYIPGEEDVSLSPFPDDDEPEVVGSGYPHLLSPNNTALERAIAGPTGRLDNAVLVPIDLLLRPWDIPEGYLPWLAWHMSLDLWDWQWDEYKKRAVTARAVELNRMKGSERAIRTYPEIMGSEVLQIVVPPQEFNIGKPLSKDEWDEWIRKNPEIRIKLIEGEGVASYDAWYIQSGYSGAVPDTSPPTEVPLPDTDDNKWGFIGESFLFLDEGPILHGRRVIVRQDGVDVPAQYVRKTTDTIEGQVVEVEHVSIPGQSTLGFFVGQDFLGDDKFLAGKVSEVEPRLFNVRLDSTYDHETSALWLDLLLPDFKPRSPRYERTSDIGDAGPYLFIGDFFIGADDQYELESGETTFGYPPAIIQRNRAGDMLADRIYLIDPAVPVPFLEGMSFIGVDRIGMPAFTADVMVDLKTKDPVNFFLDTNCYIGQPDCFINDYDDYYMERSLRALQAAKSARDRVYANFAPYRQITATDVMTPGTQVGEWVRDSL